MLKKIGVALVASVAAVGLCEVGARLLGVFRPSTHVVPFPIEGDEWRASYTLDPDFGFRPVFGSKSYDERGFLRNAYGLDKPAGVHRVLFIGDSVTARGRIVAALRARYGDDGYEWWNAGVESFSLVQSARYFERFARVCEPDHVVLTFHYNDFQTTPVTFLDDDGQPVLYAPPRSRDGVNPWLFEHSSLYRRIIKTVEARRGDGPILEEMRGELTRLRDWARANGACLSVLFHPFLRPRAQWDEEHARWHGQAKVLCETVGIEVVDLNVPLQRLHADGVEVTESEDDYDHPGDLAAAAFAEYAASFGLLERGRDCAPQEGDG